MNPLLKKTVGRLPLFRSLANKADAPPAPPPPARPTPQPRAVPDAPAQERPKLGVPDESARERAKLAAKLDAIHDRISAEPNLVPPPELMRTEGITTLEEWFRRGEEWGTLLRAYGNISAAKAVLEIGCGLGDVALALRDVLPRSTEYEGLDAAREKIDFLRATMTPAYLNFRFTQAEGGGQHRLPYEDGRFDVIFAVSAFTHLLPEPASSVLKEAKRVLAPDGQIVLGMLLLDHYEPGRARSGTFQQARFNIDHRFGQPSREEFRVGDAQDPTDVTAYASSYLAQLAGDAGLRFAHHSIPGQWSGANPEWVGRLDLVVLEHTPTVSREVSYLDRL